MVVTYYMTVSKLGNELLKNVGGAQANNLNEIIKLLTIDEDHQETFSTSNYYDLDALIKSCNEKKSSLSVLSLNIDGLNTKFNQLTAFLSILNDAGIYFNVIMLQQTMLPKTIDNKVLNSYSISGYHPPIHQGFECGCKGGLLIYLDKIYQYSKRDLYTPSKHW